MPKKKSPSKAQVRQQQFAAAEAERQEMLDQDMAEHRQAMTRDFALVVILGTVYFVRGPEFDALGQLYGLVISWLVGLLIMDAYFLFRRLPRPAHWIRRIGPAVLIGLVVFVLAFVLPN